MNPEPYQITIRKAIHGNYVSIDRRKLVEAKRNHQMLRITILGKGSAIVDPQVWYDTAVQKEKRRVNYSTPMEFIYNYVPIEGVLKARKHVSVDQLNLL